MKKPIAVVAALALGATLTASPTEAVGRHRGCHSYERVWQTNDWKTFSAHKIRVESTACIRTGSKGFQNYPYVKWVRRPHVSYPTTFPLSLEEVSPATRPHVTGIWRNRWGQILRVRYSFAARLCTSYLHLACQTLPYRVYETGLFTRICASFGGHKCDGRKYW
jgi:hypothetical protein